MDVLLYFLGCITVTLTMAISILISPQPGGDWPTIPPPPALKYWPYAGHWILYRLAWLTYLRRARISLCLGKWDHLRGLGMLMVLGGASFGAAAAVGGYAPPWHGLLLVDGIALLSALHTRLRWLAAKEAEDASRIQEHA